MNLNALKYTCSTQFYLRHPLRFLKDTIYNFRAAKRRIKYGYSSRDVWNMSDWFLEVIPSMLRYLAENCEGYPGNDDFPTPEAWDDWLNATADVFESLQEDNWFSQNEYEEEFNRLNEQAWEKRFQHYDDNGDLHVTMSSNENEDEHHKEISKLWFARAQELSEQRKQLLRDVGAEFFKHFDSLWD